MWATLWRTDSDYCMLPLTTAIVTFCADAGISEREFRRWLSRRQTYAVGSSKDVEYSEKVAARLAKVQAEMAETLLNGKVGRHAQKMPYSFPVN